MTNKKELRCRCPSRVGMLSEKEMYEAIPLVVRTPPELLSQFLRVLVKPSQKSRPD